MNIQLAHAVLQKCVDAGVETFVVCAGARNAPFVKILAASSVIETQYFYDERAAAFFALGRAKRDNRPVVVVTTSGTAVAETYPAVIEAYYSGYPLVILSADRPHTYRGTGAPQAIEHPGIFAQYAGHTVDIRSPQDVPDQIQILNAPVHLNVCLHEPLIDGPIEPLRKTSVSFPFIKNTFTEISVDQQEKLRTRLAPYRQPLFLVSTLLPEEKCFVADVLMQTHGLVYAECAAGISADPDCKTMTFLDEQSLRNLKPGRDFDLVVRIGGVPTTRFWRDLEEKHAAVPVISFSRLPFTGLARANLGVWPVNALAECTQLGPQENSYATAFTAAAGKLNLLFKKYPRSEPALLAEVVATFQNGQDVLVGNSLPIRELDLLAPGIKNEMQIWANRGANGIDGLISTALGLARSDRNMTVVLGDLSALYDLNSLSQCKSSEARQLQVVLINNAGGKIFRRMFHDSHFENQHEWRFDQWAAMFGFGYTRVVTPADVSAAEQKSFQVIEILPDDGQTEKFWDEYEQRGNP